MYPPPPFLLIGEVLANSMVILYPAELLVRTREVVVPYEVPPVSPSSVPTITTGDVLARKEIAPEIVCVTVKFSTELRPTDGSNAKNVLTPSKAMIIAEVAACWAE
jgi:hypothetical protein